MVAEILPVVESLEATIKVATVGLTTVKRVPAVTYKKLPDTDGENVKTLVVPFHSKKVFLLPVTVLIPST